MPICSYVINATEGQFEALNEELRGYFKVTTGYRDYTMYKVGH